MLGLGIWRTFKCSASLAFALGAAALPLTLTVAALLLRQLVLLALGEATLLWGLVA